MLVQSNGSYSALSSVVHGDIALSINTNYSESLVFNGNLLTTHPRMLSLKSHCAKWSVSY